VARSTKRQNSGTERMEGSGGGRGPFEVMVGLLEGKAARAGKRREKEGGGGGSSAAPGGATRRSRLRRGRRRGSCPRRVSPPPSPPPSRAPARPVSPTGSR
jgi:hypothetical protein